MLQKGQFQTLYPITKHKGLDYKSGFKLYYNNPYIYWEMRKKGMFELSYFITKKAIYSNKKNRHKLSVTLPTGWGPFPDFVLGL